MTIKEQNQNITALTGALCDYFMARSGLTAYEKRPGLKWGRVGDWQGYSCGAFRSWAIHLICGNIAVSADGYRVRENRQYGGGLYVLTGNGKWVVPPDDSRSHHSLALDCTDGAKIVCVTGEIGPWSELLPPLIEQVRQTTENLIAAAKAWDEQKAADRVQKRSAELAAAVSAFS